MYLLCFEIENILLEFCNLNVNGLTMIEIENPKNVLIVNHRVYCSLTNALGHLLGFN